MDLRKFPKQFEDVLKVSIAKELHLLSTNRNANYDFVTPDMMHMIELKLRRKREHKGGEHFTPQKRQLVLAEDKVKQTVLHHRTAKHLHPTLSYFLLEYYSPLPIQDARNVDEIIQRMQLLDGFLVDYRFIRKHDNSGQKSRWHSTTEADLYHNMRSSRTVSLLGQYFNLYLIGEEKYIPTLARRLFRG